jgi:hypothetical protein
MFRSEEDFIVRVYAYGAENFVLGYPIDVERWSTKNDRWNEWLF